MQDNSSKDDLRLPIDRGWAQMEAQLDEVMPQSRRRFVWWWFPVLALVLGGGLYAWTLMAQSYAIDTEDKTEQQAQEIPIADAVENQRQGDALSITTQQSGQPQTKTEEQPSRISHSSIIETTPVTAGTEIPTVITTTPPVGNTSEIVREKPIITASYADENDQSSPADTDMDLGTEITIPTQDEVKEEHENLEVNALKTRSLVSIASPIETLSFHPLYGSKTNISSVNPVEATPTYRYFVEGLLSETLSDPFHSVVAGIGVERSINRKWEVSAAVQYQYSRSHLFPALADPDDVLLGVAEPENFDTNTVVYDINPGLRDLEAQRLNLYTQASYQIRPRIRLGLGVQTSFFKKATAVGYNGLADEYTQSPTIEANSDSREIDLYGQGVAVSSYDQVTNAYSAPRVIDVRRWQWTLRSSVAYRLHPAWSVEFQYLRHMSSWPTKEDPYGGSNSLQLGVRYYFRK